MGHRDTDKFQIREKPGTGMIQEFLQAQAKRYGIWLVGGTLPLETPEGDRTYNTSLVFSPDGALAARYDKVHLFSFRKGTESYDESVSIRPGDNAPQAFDAPCGKVGLSICYRSEEHTSELQSLMRISYAVFCLKKKTINSQDLNKNNTN